MSKKYDLIVVGAGPFGLISAHTWLELNPNHEVLLLESGPELGGVWSKSRVYSTMMTQTPVGMFEYSSYPMEKLESKDTFYDLFKGAHVTSYLESFAARKDHAGKSIKDRILFDSPVKHVEKNAGLWNVEVTPGKSFSTAKLIVATGLTSLPNIPDYPSKDFTPPIIHSRYLAAQTPLLSSPETKSVVVIGGAKSAFDAITLLRSLPTPPTINWLIRTKGQGPALLSTPDAPWPLSNSHEIISTRFVSKMSPCIYEPLDNWARFWHRNWLGIWLADKMWAGVTSMWHAAAGYGRDENMGRLKPERPVFWSSDGIAVYNSKGMWDTVSEAKVIRGDVASLEGKEVVLETGERIECDAVIAAAGWINTFPMFSDALAKDLGLPMLMDQADSEDITEWESRIGEATEMVINIFPRLSKLPSYSDHAPKSTPSRLYRSVAPINDEDHSIAFVGAVGTTQSLTVAEIQALWAVAYLTGGLKTPSEEGMKSIVALATAWRRRRYLGDGYTILFEQLQYQSLLLRDLGVNDLRKGGGWKEIFSPYTPADYRGILEEWKATQKADVRSV